MKFLISVLVLALILYGIYRTYTYVHLADGLETKLRKGAIILDVRTSREFKMGHMAGAVNISLGELRNRYVELDTSKVYITTCSHGLRSVKAADILKERGFAQVYNGGAWTDLQKMVEHLSLY